MLKIVGNPVEEHGYSNIESKLIEIEKKVDQMLESPTTVSKKVLKKHEKKLFDVDINLNISTDAQSSVKRLSATSTTNVNNK